VNWNKGKEARPVNPSKKKEENHIFQPNNNGTIFFTNKIRREIPFLRTYD